MNERVEGLSDACLALDLLLGDPLRDILGLDRGPLTLQCADSLGAKHGCTSSFRSLCWRSEALREAGGLSLLCTPAPH